MSSSRSLGTESRNKSLRISSLTKSSLGLGGREWARFGFSRTSSIRSFGIYATSTLSKIDEHGVYDPGPPVIEGSLNISKKIMGYKEIMCCRVLKSKSLLALGHSDGTVECHDSKRGVVVQSFALSGDEDHKMPATSISFVRDNFLFSSYVSGHSKLWERSSSNCVWTIDENRQTLINTVRPDNEVIAVGGTDSKINLYDVNSQKLIRTLESSEDEDVMDGHTMRVFALKYHPRNRNQLVSGGWDNNIMIWDDREPNAVRKIFGPHICGEGIDFSGDGGTLVTASWRKHDSLQLWSYNNGKLIRTVNPDNMRSFLYCCEYVPEKNVILAGGGNNNLVRVVECGSWMTIGCYKNLPGAVYCLGELPTDKQRDLSFCIGFTQCCYMMEIESS